MTNAFRLLSRIDGYWYLYNTPRLSSVSGSCPQLTTVCCIMFSRLALCCGKWCDSVQISSCSVLGLHHHHRHTQHTHIHMHVHHFGGIHCSHTFTNCTLHQHTRTVKTGSTVLPFPEQRSSHHYQQCIPEPGERRKLLDY